MTLASLPGRVRYEGLACFCSTTATASVEGGRSDRSSEEIEGFLDFFAALGGEGTFLGEAESLARAARGWSSESDCVVRLESESFAALLLALRRPMGRVCP